jgi:caa(3)-type oxidase subunit IV
MSEEHAHHPNYVKIWAILVMLLIVSVIGPMIGIRAVTLLAAFGVAAVKAYLVAKNFMHIDLAPRYVAYLAATCLVFMLLFFSGASPDVMQAEGSNWVKPSWQEASAAVAPDHGDHH